LFDFDAVATVIADKLEARHPHVFGEAAIAGVALQTRAWEAHKAEERRRKAEAAGRAPSVLDDVPLALPALLRAEKLQKRAARVGFDWPETAQVLAKIEEELGELRAELPGGDKARLSDELGDILFAAANLARHLGIDPEAALRGTNAKFEHRFQAIEAGLGAIGKTPDQATLEEMEALWQAAKSQPNRDDKSG
jgi:MazG family protein